MILKRNMRHRVAVIALGSMIIGMGGAVFAQKPKPVSQPGNAPNVAVPQATRLTYSLKSGDTFRYRITGFFQGNIPPFTQPGSPPINVKTVLEYVGTVKKQDDKGAEVAFEVDKADLILMAKEPGPNGKVDPDDEIPWPLPLSQVQKTLNITALIRPDGSVANIVNVDAAPLRIELGIDLRKLFLLMMPVTFPDRPVKVNETWTHQDGVLGQKPGKISYSNRLLAVSPAAKSLTYRIEQNVASQVDDKKDKDGRLIDDTANAVETTTGKATVTGTLLFQTPAASGQVAGMRAGRMQKGQLTLNADLTRIAPNPEKPEEKQTSHIVVKARLQVQAVPNARKPAAKTAASARPSKVR